GGRGAPGGRGGAGGRGGRGGGAGPGGAGAWARRTGGRSTRATTGRTCGGARRRRPARSVGPRPPIRRRARPGRRGGLGARPRVARPPPSRGSGGVARPRGREAASAGAAWGQGG